MRVLFSFFMVLSLFLVSAFAADKPKPLVLGETENPSYYPNANHFGHGKVAWVDPYTGKLRLRLPLLDVPVSQDLHLHVVVTNLERKRYTWHASRHYSGFEWSDKLGMQTQLSPGVTANVPDNDYAVFLDPQGFSHVFIPLDTDENSYLSPDGWRATLVRKDAGHAKYNLQMFTFEGKITSPNGTVYTITPGQGSFSPLTYISNAAGTAWIQYTYSGNNLTQIDTSSGYQINYSYGTFDVSGGVQHISLVTAMKTNTNRSWSFGYDMKGGTGQVFGSALLSSIQLPDGHRWLLNQSGYQYHGNRELRFLPQYLQYPNGAKQQFQVTYDTSDRRFGLWYISKETFTGLPNDYSVKITHGKADDQVTTTFTYPNKRIIYTMNDDYPNNHYDWDTGLVTNIKVQDAAGKQTLKEVSNQWKHLVFSNKVAAAYPELNVRDIAQNGLVYRTINMFDDHAYPVNTTQEEMSADGNIIHARHFVRAFKEDLDKWIFKLTFEELKNADNELVNDISRTYDDFGRLLISNDNGRLTTFTYDDKGNIDSKTGALGDITRYKKYVAGHPTQVVDALGSTTNDTVNLEGEVLSSTDALGNTTFYTYDNMGRITQAIPPRGALTNYQYITPDSDGDYQRILTRGAYQETLFKNALGMETKRIEKDTSTGWQRVTSTQYDDGGRVVFTSYPYADDSNTKPSGISRMYDPLGRLISTTDAAGNQTTYAYDEDTVITTDAKGNKTLRSYLYYNLPDKTCFYGTKGSSLCLVSLTDAKGNITTIKRAANGLVQEIDQGNFARQFNYDAHHFLVSETNPETGLTTFDRDAQGNLTGLKVGDASKVTYTYDLLSRLTKTHFQDGTSDIVDVYDKLGRLSTAKQGNSEWSYHYDQNSNLLSSLFTLNGQAFNFVYSYDDLDHLTSIFYPSGRSINYLPDTLGYAHSASPILTSASYLPNGHLASYTDALGEETTYAQNDNNQISSLSVSSGGVKVIDRSYFYDQDNNLRSIRDNINEGDGKTFVYDANNQLEFAGGPWGEGHYDYDVMGNMRLRSVGQQVFRFYYDNHNRLDRTIGSINEYYHYDSAGNISAINDRKLIFNAASQLVSNGDYHYSYDANGNRDQVIQPGKKPVIEIYNRGDQLLYKLDKNTGEQTDYVYLAGQLVGQVVSSNDNVFFNYQQNDLQGSPIRLVRHNGDTSVLLDYEPYGVELQSDPDASEEHTSFTGKQFNRDTGLSYMNARYYLPTIGRFISIDPVDVDPNSSLTFNRYIYGNNNPYLYTDPTGMFSIGNFFSELGNQLAEQGFAFSVGFDFGASGGTADIGFNGHSFMDYTMYYGGMGMGATAGMLIGTSEEGIAARLSEGVVGDSLLNESSSASNKVVLGHYPEYVQEAERLNARYFNIPEKAWNSMSEKGRWSANQKFLERAISRGDEIHLATPISKLKANSYYESELRYLSARGYRPNAEGSEMIKR